MANGTLKVQNIETSSGSGTITLGQSGETIALGASNISGFGKIGQVVQTTDTTSTATTSSSYTSTPITVSITPSSTSSKILILAQVSFRIYNSSGANADGHFSIYDGSSHIWENKVRTYDYGNSGSIMQVTNCYVYLDSPATTSQKTYTVYQKLNGGTEMEINPNNNGDSSITAMEILP